jgi:hypothetical protein
MTVSLSFSGRIFPRDFQEAHVLYSRQIVNQNSDKKPHFETMPVNQSLIAHGLPPLIFVTADDRLITATRGDAMTTENPNLHP